MVVMCRGGGGAHPSTRHLFVTLAPCIEGERCQCLGHTSGVSNVVSREPSDSQHICLIKLRVVACIGPTATEDQDKEREGTGKGYCGARCLG